MFLATYPFFPPLRPSSLPLTLSSGKVYLTQPLAELNTTLPSSSVARLLLKALYIIILFFLSFFPLFFTLSLPSFYSLFSFFYSLFFFFFCLSVCFFLINLITYIFYTNFFYFIYFLYLMKIYI